MAIGSEWISGSIKARSYTWQIDISDQDADKLIKETMDNWGSEFEQRLADQKCKVYCQGFWKFLKMSVISIADENI